MAVLLKFVGTSWKESNFYINLAFSILKEMVGTVITTFTYYSLFDFPMYESNRLLYVTLGVPINGLERSTPIWIDFLIKNDNQKYKEV